MMSRKDYSKAAEIVKASPANHRALVACAFRDLFVNDNLRFDQARFFEACEVGSSGKKKGAPYDR
jgi:hypothetical protein